MNNYFAKIKEDKRGKTAYLALKILSPSIHHLCLSDYSGNAQIFSDSLEAQERISLFCFLNPDYSIEDFEIVSF